MLVFVDLMCFATFERWEGQHWSATMQLNRHSDVFDTASTSEDPPYKREC
jgi:hypothetical protein